MSRTALHGRSAIHALLEKHGIRARKSLGQNFLADPNVVERIVRVAEVAATDNVVEVGTGTGTLTRALAAAAGRVVTYEVDERFRPLHADTLADLGNVEVRYEDAARVNLGADLDGDRWVMVANMPYNVGTPILMEALRNAPEIERFVVMLQREVAERLIASPGSKTYGLPSVSLALRASARRSFNVPPQVFLPRPDVDSSVVLIERRSAHPAAGPAEVLAGVAFNQRRKMLRRSLISALVDPSSAIAAAGLEPEARAEDLSAADYLRLAEAAQDDR